jgi:hypothetical protein
MSSFYFSVFFSLEMISSKRKKKVLKSETEVVWKSHNFEQTKSFIKGELNIDSDCFFISY